MSGDPLRSRRERLRAAAAERGLDGALVFSSRRATLAWFTGYQPGYLSNHAALWIPLVGEASLGVRFPFELARARDSSGLPVVVMPDPVRFVPDGAAAIAVVGGDMAVDETPTALTESLRQRGVTTVNLVEQVDRWRTCKSADEIAGLKRAAGSAALAFAALDAAAGRSDFAMAATVEAVVRQKGATRALCLVGIGDGAVVTEASGRTAGADDVVCLELTFHAHGVCMQCNTTLLPAAAAPYQLAAVEACRRARRAFVAAVAPGVSVDAAIDAGETSLRGDGMAAHLEYDFGHGLGADTPEHPRLVRGTGLRFEPGMAMVVHVAVRAPDGPTAFVGGPIQVTDSGATELLAKGPWAQ